MTVLGFFPKKSFVQVTAHFLFATPKKETLVTIENDFPNPSVQQFVLCMPHLAICSSHIF